MQLYHQSVGFALKSTLVYTHLQIKRSGVIDNENCSAEVHCQEEVSMRKLVLIHIYVLYNTIFIYLFRY